MTALVVILGISFSLLSFAGYFTARASLQKEITGSSLPLTGDTIYSEIKRDLLSPIFISSLMANDTFLRDWVLQGEKTPKDIIRFLRETSDKYGTVTSFFVSEKTGRYYHPDGILKTVRADEERDAWFFRVRNMKDDYEINLDVDMANGDSLTIFINYRVYDYEGNFIGATGVGLAVNAVKDLMEQYESKYSRTIFFVDREGELTLKGSGFDETVQRLSDMEGLGTFANAILSSERESLSYRADGALRFAHTRFISELGWYLIVMESEGATANPIFRALLANILLSFAVTALVFFIVRKKIRKDQSAMENLASTDKLTGLYNRLACDFLADEALKDLKRNGGDLCLLMLDLDRFKEINDSYGHLAGDGVLKDCAVLLRSSVRECDLVCRWGGEEFLLLLRDCTQLGGEKVAEDIRSRVEAHGFISGGVRLTVSVGVTRVLQSDTFDSAVSRADRALYRAKQAGRNRSMSE